MSEPAQGAEILVMQGGVEVVRLVCEPGEYRIFL